MRQTIRVLLVEDSESDAILLLRQLQNGGYEPTSTRVETAEEMLAALAKPWDIIISDYVMPGFGGLEALALVQKRELDLPFIIVSGHIGEAIAVKAMKAGAHDYLMKDNLTRLVPAVERELREAVTRSERRQADQRLKTTAEELLRSNEELRKAEEQLRARNTELVQARDELEMRVAQRTTALSRANAALRHQMEERKRLEQELLDITEQERQRIGLDLHDDLGQQLTGLAFMVKGLQQRLEQENPQRAADAEKIHGVVSQAIQHAHDVALGLTSEFDGRNLAMALHRLTQRVKDVFSVECHLDLDCEFTLLPPAAPAHLFKIAQEALTNGIKHGKARHLSIQMKQEAQKVVLSVWNDGLPFPEESSRKGRMGLRIMHYRAHVVGGSLEVRAGEKGGTVVSCSVPLDPDAAVVSEPADAVAG